MVGAAVAVVLASMAWLWSDNSSASGYLNLPPLEVDTTSSGSLDSHSPIDEYRKIFLLHATRTTEEGERLMTFDDFFQVMAEELSGTSYTIEQLRSLFRIADTNHDGCLDLSEYVLFMSLLSKPSAALHISFRLFDLDGDGLIDKAEFESVLRDQWGEGFLLLHKDWLDQMFGDQGEEKLSYHDFTRLLSALQKETKKKEFDALAVDGKITAEQFAKLVFNFDELKLPLYVQNHLKYLQEHDFSVNEAYFMNYIQVYKHLLPAERTIRIYTGAGGKLDVIRFRRALAVTSNVTLSPGQADIVFEIFDVEKKGILDESTYNNIMATRFSTVVVTQPAKEPLTVAESLLMGIISSAVGGTAVYPLDKLKTRLQSSHTGATRGLYSGLQAQIIGIVPEKTLKLFVNDFLRRALKTDKDTPLSLPREMLAGIGTGFLQVLVSTPYEMIKIRLQMESGAQKRGVVAIVRDIGSVSNLYTGLGATLFRDIPFNAIYFTLYAYLKQVLVEKDGEIGGIRLLLAGAIAAGFAAGIDTPADVIKTRLQNGKEDYKGIRDCFTRITTEEGYSALFKGVQVRMIVIAPLFAITFTTYELLKRLWRPHSESPIDLLEEHSEAMRRSRLKKVAKELKREFGLEMRISE